MNYSEIISELNKATGFDLFRLSVAIDQLLEDPKLIIEVKQTLCIGQNIEYFNSTENRPIAAIVLKFKSTRLLVENLHDNKHWNIRYYSVNTHQVETKIKESTGKKGLARTEISIGDIVGFEDREYTEQYGTVIRLNPKTVTVRRDKFEWRVPYSLLFSVHEQALDQLPNIET